MTDPFTITTTLLYICIVGLTCFTAGVTVAYVFAAEPPPRWRKCDPTKDEPFEP